ncbi:hypothetical protein QLG13_29450 (plasmid) [Rhodococcus aetherivorans]|nr:hypothetical protein [Rhodococcus aetherivorans]
MLTGAHPVGGAIRDRWAQTGWEGGPLGYPTSDEIWVGHNNEGRMNRFERGVIYWSPTTGAHSVRGDILEQWSLAGYEKRLYGYPTNEGVDDGTGWFTQQFSNGSAAGEISVPVSPPPVDYIQFDTREEALAYFESLQNGQSAPDLPQPERLSPMGLNLGPCELKPNWIHWRTKSGPGKGYGVVGFKPTTECETPVSSITHETELKYQYYGWWYTTSGIVDVESSTGASTSYLESKNVAHACTGEVETWFWGVVTGRISYMGKNYWAVVYPPKKRLNCKV